MKNTMLLCALFVTLTVSAGAQAADTAELKVAGSVRPPSCAFNLASGGVVDYGNIPPSRLSTSAATKLEMRSIAFSIDCATGKTQMALKLTDNRTSSIVPAIVTEYNGWNLDELAYGLGIVDGKKVGAYTVRMHSVKIDGYYAYLYMSAANTSANANGWTNVSSGGGGSYFSPTLIYSWSPQVAQAGSTVGATYPHAYSTVAGQLTVQVFIDKLTNLPVRDAIPLDGSATLELLYM